MKSSLSRVAFLVSPPQSLGIQSSNSCAKFREKHKAARVPSQRSGRNAALSCCDSYFRGRCQCSLQPVKRTRQKSPLTRLEITDSLIHLHPYLRVE
jgi:hypothetical protein